MKIKYSLDHENAKEPIRVTEGSLAFDLYAASIAITDKYIEYDTGIKFEFPEGWGARMYARSSISNKDLMLANAVALIDSDFRNSVKFRFKTVNSNIAIKGDIYSVGDRVGQIVFEKLPRVELERVETVKESETRKGGFGHSGQRELNGQQIENKSEDSEEGRES